LTGGAETVESIGLLQNCLYNSVRRASV